MHTLDESPGEGFHRAANLTHSRAANSRKPRALVCKSAIFPIETLRLLPVSRARTTQMIFFARRAAACGRCAAAGRAAACGRNKLFYMERAREAQKYSRWVLIGNESLSHRVCRGTRAVGDGATRGPAGLHAAAFSPVGDIPHREFFICWRRAKKFIRDIFSLFRAEKKFFFRGEKAKKCP